MSFLAPLFLLGALAVAWPILWHLIRRRTRDKIPFSSLMFLAPTPPRVSRRSRLEHVLLLILRCLVLCLLALAFARPFIQSAVSTDSVGPGDTRTVILVDTSASMRRNNLWTEAQNRVRSVLRSAAPNDGMALCVFDRGLRRLVAFDQWRELGGERVEGTLQRLAANPPGYASTHLGAALIGAANLLEADLQQQKASSSTGIRRIVLISDFQDGCHLDGLQGFDWPRGIEVVLDPLAAKNTSNAGLHWIPESEESAALASEDSPRLRISNAADSIREQFQIRWLNQADPAAVKSNALEVYVPAGQSRIVSAPKRVGAEAEGRLRLTGDQEDFDNLVYVTPPPIDIVNVIYLGADQENDPGQLRYFLRLALPNTPRQQIRLLARSPTEAWPAPEAPDAALLVVADTAAPAQIERMRDLVRSGKTVLWVAQSRDAATGLAAFLSLPGVAMEEAPTNTYAMLGQIDFQHPLFAPFADPRYSDFTKIHFWRHRRLADQALPGARVIGRFDNGDPAILQVAVGQGSLFVLTAGWQPGDSQLAVSSKFVPLLRSLLELSRHRQPLARQYAIGDRVSLDIPASAAAVRVIKPDGSSVDMAPGASEFLSTDMPGINTVALASAPERFAVNLAPEESRTAPMSLVDLERLGVPVRSPIRADQPQLNPSPNSWQEAAERENRQKMWRWLLVAALAAVILETGLAGWLTHRRDAPKEVQT